jgi:hypothetical protein
MGLRIELLKADNSREIDAAFATFSHERRDALFVSSGPLFSARRVQLALLAARYVVPATYAGREYAEAGGLMSYGARQCTGLGPSQDTSKKLRITGHASLTGLARYYQGCRPAVDWARQPWRR